MSLLSRSVLLSMAWAAAPTAPTATPTAAQLTKFWEGSVYNTVNNMCAETGLKDEEPWKTVCSTPHTLCNNAAKFDVHYESWMGALANSTYNVNVSNGKGYDKFGRTGKSMASFDVTIDNKTETFYYLCAFYRPGNYLF